MKIAISQPTYLPWQGYFALIEYVDEFIFLENIQFNKRSWQQRNKILNNRKEVLLTIPVKTKGRFDQKIYDVELDNFEKHKIKQIVSIQNAYSNCKYFNKYFPKLESIFYKKHIKLSDLNKELIFCICQFLDINTVISSDKSFNLSSKKAKYLRDICLLKKCSSYISTVGSKSYFSDIKFFPNTNIKIEYFEFKNNAYSQISKNFVSNLSIIDLLFNVGPNSLKYLRNNFFICK